MIYCKKIDGVFYCREEQVEGYKPVNVVGDITYQALVDTGSEWVHDEALLAQHQAEQAKQVAVQSRLSAQDFGATFLAQVIELNKAKYIAGVFTAQTLDQMDEDAVLQKLERSAWRGNIPTLKALILANASHLLTWYTEAEQTEMVSQINAYLGA